MEKYVPNDENKINPLIVKKYSWLKSLDTVSLEMASCVQSNSPGWCDTKGGEKRGR